MAHESSQHITEPEFNSKWDETEKAISDIAKTVGNYFAKTIKRKVDEFNQAPLPTEDIKKNIESSADDVKKVGTARSVYNYV